MSFAFLLLDDIQRANALGRQEAFEALYSLYYEPVRRYLYQLCGATDQAEELAQETFVKAAQASWPGRRASKASCAAKTCCGAGSPSRIGARSTP